MADTSHHAAGRGHRAPEPGRAAQRRPANVSAHGGPAAAGVDALGALHASAGNRATGLALRGGVPLPDAVRTEMQLRYGADFSQVRVHSGAAAAASAEHLHANAYAVGPDIVFGPGRYAPHSREGRRLLAHELAHVVQQSRGGPAPALDPGAPHEQQADRAADAVVSTAGAVSVEGATGVGVAADVKGWLKEKADGARALAAEAKDLVPEDVREFASDAADTAIDYAPYVAGGPLLGTIVDFQKAAINDAREAVTGVDDPNAHGLRETAARKVDMAVGVSKGVATQFTDLADNVLWAGAELRDAKSGLVDKAADAAGVDRDTASKVSRVGSWLAVPVAPGLLLVDALGGGSDAVKDAGLVDENGKASLTTPVQNFYDAVGDGALDLIGAPKEADDALFTQREKGELVGAVGIQVAGAFVGATEVKVALSLLGALGGIRGVVETMRAHPSDFYSQPSFWSGFLGAALSIVGLKGNGAAKKVIDIALKCGALVQAVPHLWQLYNDYNDPALQADEEKYRKTLNRDLQAVIKAVVDIVVTIIRNGRAGKPTPKFKGAPPAGGSGAPEGGTTAAPQTAKPPSAKAQKKANLRADNANTAAAKSATAAQEAQARAAARETQAKASRERSDAQQAKADKNAAALQSSQTDAQAKAQALADARQAAAAQGGSDAKAQARLQRAADAADKSAAAARQKAANAQKRADASSTKAGTKEALAARAEARAQKAKADADAASARAKRAQARADKALAKAEAMKPPVDPQSVFDGATEPAFAAAPDAPAFKPNAEPLVWVRTGKGKNRWTWVPEGDPAFGQGRGVALPKSEANGRNFTPAGQDTQPVPITQRTGANGRPVESAGAGGDKGSRFASATAETPEAASKTSIRPDVDENQAYKLHLDQGEVGILRPLGSNLGGVDSITARIVFDAKGRPVRAKIFLNDTTTPDAGKGPKKSHQQWREKLASVLDPKAPAGQRLNFGDPALEAVIRQAAADGNVFIRIVRTAPAVSGTPSISMNPAETWRAGPVVVPRLPNLVAPRDDEREPGPGDKSP